MDDEEILLRISPALFFEILLRKAARDLAKASYTLEKTRSMRIPVFDSQDLVKLLNEDTIVIILADMGHPAGVWRGRPNDNLREGIRLWV